MTAGFRLDFASGFDSALAGAAQDALAEHLQKSLPPEHLSLQSVEGFTESGQL